MWQKSIKKKLLSCHSPSWRPLLSSPSMNVFYFGDGGGGGRLATFLQSGSVPFIMAAATRNLCTSLAAHLISTRVPPRVHPGVKFTPLQIARPTPRLSAGNHAWRQTNTPCISMTHAIKDGKGAEEAGGAGRLSPDPPSTRSHSR